MVSSVWWREAGAASDWRGHPHDGSEREKPEPKFESFKAEMFADLTIYTWRGTHKDLDDS
jgi:hypothetical protein